MCYCCYCVVGLLVKGNEEFGFGVCFWIGEVYVVDDFDDVELL